MNRATHAFAALATLCSVGILATTLTAVDASPGVRDVPGVRNANPTADSRVKVTLRDNDGVVEGTVVASDSHWVALDKADGTTAWIPTTSILMAHGERKPVR